MLRQFFLCYGRSRQQDVQSFRQCSDRPLPAGWSFFFSPVLFEKFLGPTITPALPRNLERRVFSALIHGACRAKLNGELACVDHVILKNGRALVGTDEGRMWEPVRLSARLTAPEYSRGSGAHQ